MGEPSLPDAERLYREASCGLALADETGDLLLANDTLCAWLECEAGDLVGRKRFQDLLTMGGRIFWQTHLQPLLRMQSSVAEVKLEMVRQRSAALPVMVNVSARPWEGRRLLHVSVFVAEDRHKYERELLLQRRRAEELAALHARDQQQVSEARLQAEDRAIFAEQLVGVVSHDIRNPLAVVQMSAAILERSSSPDQHRQAVGRIGRAVRRMQHLISDLLDFSQARLGRGLSIAPRDCDLQQAVDDAVAELAAAFPDAVLRHERVGRGRFDADPERITQALGNLVANAVHHGAPGEPVTVRSEAAPEAFTLTVHNFGPPIPPEQVPVLFEPMVRGAAAASKGVGLGLFIVREIVRGHGGEVRVESGAQGTSFVIVLPRR